MPFHVETAPYANRQILSWQLSDFLFMEVQLRLRDLGQNTSQQLVRLTQPFEGMCFIFEMIDPQIRTREHLFDFSVFYSMDEERLIVVRGSYHRRDA